ncbi:aldehyde dehydrogenase [Coprinopsis marcescibilis]|uniref:Aldehyde dehydrogenase n=1 Tax=Coprinopsis marcescibilis TaxID=230819 RepID=A0A5C3KFW4_COPMA|nr:aldehyde dehydrogenase [Coprinopsis marcescibilis]
MEAHHDELAALETLDNGKTFRVAKNDDVVLSIAVIKYYAGWADKITGQTLETDEKKLVYTRHEPIGVVGQIIPWNLPLLMLVMKLGPALATGNTIEAGFPPGVINILTGYGPIVGAAIASHRKIDKVAFTGSTLVGRKIMEMAAKSNLKNVTLELGGKSPTVVFDDADLDAAIAWAFRGLFWNHGQACCAGSRIFVHAKIYDEFLKKFTERPQVSQIQYERIMSYIESGKSDGATVHLGGERYGTEGYFVQPTIFTGVTPDMKIVKEEIFGPVGVVIKFDDDEHVISQANNTLYGLAAAVFSQNINRALSTVHKLQAGTVWVNAYNQFHANVPFGGFKQSGIGREFGEYALQSYTNVKAVHVNIGHVL